MVRSNPQLWEKSKSEAKAKLGGKHCTTCKEYKDISEFTANRSQASGYMGYCKDCNNSRNKRYRKQEANIQSGCKRLYSYLTRRVRVKNLDLDFDAVYLEGLFNIQGGKCAYTGEKLELNAGYSNTFSVDRVDSSLGYTKDNIVLTTWEVNNCKQDLSLERFKNLCSKVISHVSYE